MLINSKFDKLTMLRIDLAGAEYTIVKLTIKDTINKIFIFSKIISTILKEMNASSDIELLVIADFYTRDV